MGNNIKIPDKKSLKLANTIIEEAIHEGAITIQVMPQHGRTLVRYRSDGRLILVREVHQYKHGGLILAFQHLYGDRPGCYIEGYTFQDKYYDYNNERYILRIRQEPTQLGMSIDISILDVITI